MSRYKVIVDKTKTKFIIRSENGYAPRIVNRFLKQKNLENRSPNTIKSIAFSLAYYCTYLEQQETTIKQVLEMNYTDQQEHFFDFLNWCSNGEHTDKPGRTSNRTSNLYLKKVLEFYQYLSLEMETHPDLKVLKNVSVRYVTQTGVRMSRQVASYRGYLPEEDRIRDPEKEENLVTLIGACRNIRDQLLILMLAETGFRIGELLGVRYTDDIQGNRIYVRARFANLNRVRAKNAEERYIQISNSTKTVLDVYLSRYSRQLQNTDYLFINRKGQPLTEDAVYSVFRALEKRTGIKTTPHKIRHYFATERYHAHWDIVLIQHALGHKQLATTERYIHLNEEDLARATEDFYNNKASTVDISSLL